MRHTPDPVNLLIDRPGSPDSMKTVFTLTLLWTVTWLGSAGGQSVDPRMVRSTVSSSGGAAPFPGYGDVARYWEERFSPIFGNRLPGDLSGLFSVQYAPTGSGPVPPHPAAGRDRSAPRIVLPLTGVGAEDRRELGHGLAHVYQFAIAARIKGGEAGLDELPRWFIEGMAQYLSQGARAPITTMWLRDAVLHDRVPELDRMGALPAHAAAQYGHALLSYVAGRWGDKILGKLLKSSVRYGIEAGFEEALGVGLGAVFLEWRELTLSAFTPAVTGRTAPSLLGRHLVRKSGDAGAPAISPDGRYVVFVSRCNRESGIYLAYAETGRVVRKLRSCQVDSRFDALRFAGAWSDDASRLAVPARHGKSSGIEILAIPSGAVIQSFAWQDVSDIGSLAWTPDGRYLVASGLCRGVSDLFLHDRERGQSVKLTDDPAAQLHPAWSPDGAKLAFLTDGVEGPISSGPARMRIAVMTMRDGSVRMVAIADWATHGSPQFGPTGTDLYFIADPDGVGNIYRYTWDGKQFRRLTDVATGISGTSPLSSALSVAWRTGEAVCTVMMGSGFTLRAMTMSAGVPFVPDESAYRANSLLPPSLRPGAVVP